MQIFFVSMSAAYLSLEILPTFTNFNIFALISEMCTSGAIKYSKVSNK